MFDHVKIILTKRNNKSIHVLKDGSTKARSLKKNSKNDIYQVVHALNGDPTSISFVHKNEKG